MFKIQIVICFILIVPLKMLIRWLGSSEDVVFRPHIISIKLQIEMKIVF